MDMVDLGAVAALLSVPTALVAAWWTQRSAESATPAALLAGRIQADTAISAVQTQSLLQRDQQRHIALDSACMEFLSVSDTLVGVVKRGYDLDRRGEFPCRILRIGRTTRVVTASLLRVLESGGPGYNGVRAGRCTPS
ncbi:hypothetical protein ACFWOJ_13155 [Streptomyces sp. NPDC058439]|uniref:hypothetical protein n=1 Tax=Streptomyces sp. NPDC058439 TaxID=3346500 RepID=UPI00365AF141